MANIHFRPNKGKKVVDTSIPQVIYLRYKLGRTIDFNPSIGFKVLLDNWDYDKQQVKNRSTVLDRQEINNLIKNLTDHFYRFELKNREKGIIPNYKEVKEYFDSFYTIYEDNK